MKERPILFSAPMVLALLAGAKTATRRLVKPAPPSAEEVHAKAGIDFSIFTDDHSPGTFRVGGPVWAVRDLMGVEPGWVCPFGVAGDQLWVRESLVDNDDGGWRYAADNSLVILDSTKPSYGAALSWAHHKEGERCNSIHMPRFASRITLEVESVRVERLQDISEEDAKAEGVTTDAQQGTVNGAPATLYPITHRQAFIWLWDQLNGERAPWASNPFCWVVSFRRLP
jgi:hypothetical protein